MPGPPASRQAYRSFTDPTLPYRTFSDATSEDPQLAAGQNLLSSPKGQLERRGGFATPLESAVTSFSGTVSNMYSWRRWGDSFFVMLNETTATTSKVYKLRLGTDTSFVLLYTATAVDGAPFYFTEANNCCFFGNGTAADMKKYDGTTVTRWGIVAPSAVPVVSTIAGTLNAAAGYNYVYTYGNSSTGHQSSPSATSNCTGTFSAKAVQIPVVASTDPQVDQIHVYRSTDNGGTDTTLMREIGNSPFTNTTATLSDQTLDSALSSAVAPGIGINDPPPGLKGFAHYAGRIWGFVNNKLWYSAFEEATQGVPEESWPGASTSSIDGNFYNFSSEVGAVAALSDGVAAYLPTQIWEIIGDSLDTFYRVKLADGQGARSQLVLQEYGDIVHWLDTQGTLWMLGGNERGYDIRPDLAAINQMKAMLVNHLSGELHWLALLDGGNNKLFIYSYDLKQWMTPWVMGGGQTITAIWSGETAVGQVDLLAAVGGKVYKYSTTSFNDAGQTYSAFCVTGLLPLVAESNPEWRGVLDSVNYERSAVGELSDVAVLMDDDPSMGGHRSIIANVQDSPLRSAQGTFIIARQCPDVSAKGRRVSVRLDWPAADRVDILHTLHFGYHPDGA